MRLVRGPATSNDQIQWDSVQPISPDAVSGFDAVIHLAGESIVGRWTAAKKQAIRDSRVLGTSHLAAALAKANRKPQIFICSSAIGYYGDRGDESVSEWSAPGEDFLAYVSRDWEAATTAVARAGIRVVNTRFGVVLTTAGGALATMLPAFRLGLGGQVGSGDQYLSWITLDDALQAIVHVLTTSALVGPVNLTAPTPVTNREFAKTLGKVLGRPAIVRVPDFALKLAFGAEGAAMLRSGQRVLPKCLLASGFHFRFDTVEPALRYLLARSETGR